MSSYKTTTLTRIPVPDPLAHPDLPFIIDDFSLALHLGVRCKTLWYCIEGLNYMLGPRYQNTRMYKKFTIKKSSGKPRYIYNPNNVLKFIQRRLDKYILGKLPLLDCVGAYVAGKSCRDSAAQHVQKGVLVKIDLADFFPSHSRARVRRFLRDVLGYSHFVAGLMATLCTVKESIRTKSGKDKVRTLVPQGSPVSPRLCNLIAQSALDAPLLAVLEHGGGWSYTRYSDDLVLSHPEDVQNKDVDALVKLVIDHVHRAGYRINPDKLRIQRRWHRQKMLGMVVNQHPNIPRNVYRKYRAVVHNCLRQGFTVNALRYGDAYADTPGTFLTHLQGKISYFHSVNAERATVLSDVLKQAVERHTDEHGQLQ